MLKGSYQKFEFKGFYQKFEDAPKTGGGFQAPFWINRERERLKEAFDETALELSACKDYPLITSAAALVDDKRSLTILDFGGGSGITFLKLAGGLDPQIKINFTVIDSKRMCDMGREVFNNREKVGGRSVNFYSTIEDASKNIQKSLDILHIGGVLQYIRDWQAVLTQLIHFNPKTILLSDLPAGDIEEFTTSQDLFGSLVPWRFYNLKSLTEFFKSVGYQPILKTHYHVKQRGKYIKLPTKHFPKESRIENAVNLMYKKIF